MVHLCLLPGESLLVGLAESIIAVLLPGVGSTLEGISNSIPRDIWLALDWGLGLIRLG